MLPVPVIDLMVLTHEQKSSRVWIDHVDLSSDMDHDKDYVSGSWSEIRDLRSDFGQYDGLLDITHGCTFVTVSWTHLHDVRPSIYDSLLAITNGRLALEGVPRWSR